MEPWVGACALLLLLSRAANAPTVRESLGAEGAAAT
jgi:hypothetical protein